MSTFYLPFNIDADLYRPTPAEIADMERLDAAERRRRAHSFELPDIPATAEDFMLGVGPCSDCGQASHPVGCSSCHPF